MKVVFILCGHKNFIILGFLGSLKRHLTFIFAGDMEAISFNPFKAYFWIKLSNISKKKQRYRLIYSLNFDAQNSYNFSLLKRKSKNGANVYDKVLYFSHKSFRLNSGLWCANDNRRSPDAHWSISLGSNLSFSFCILSSNIYYCHSI